MPAPSRNHVQVVRCKGCKRCIPVSVEVTSGSLTVACPVCIERRSYIVSTEVFLGQPSREVMRRASEESVMNERTESVGTVAMVAGLIAAVRLVRWIPRN